MKSNAPRNAKQTGYSLLIVLVLLVTGALGFSLRMFDGADVQLERDKVTRRALAEAKQALIGFATTASQGPGHFVCPDDDNDGDSAGGCSASVGRLPWKTLRLSDLRDGNGERLWYAVSENFINKVGNSVNSDTKGQIKVSGSNIDEAVAVIFSPGTALSGQSRNGANELDIKNYLEGANSDAAANEFETQALSGSFNDQILVIHADDLSPVVENAVAARMRAELLPVLEAYFSAWNAYPSAAPFDGRSSNASPTVGGTANLSGGILPIDLPDIPNEWTDCGSAMESQVTTEPLGSVSTAVGAVASNNECKITITYTGAPTNISITLTMSVPAGHGFYGRYCPQLTPKVRLELAPDNFTSPPPQPSNPPSAVDACKTVTGSWSNTQTSLYTVSRGSFVSANGSFDSLGKAQVTYTIDTSGENSPLIFNVRPPLRSPVLTKAGLAVSAKIFPEKQLLEWFFANDWHRLTYYQTASGSLVCSGTLCISVKSPAGTVLEQARAALVLGGRALPSITNIQRTNPPEFCDPLNPGHRTNDYLSVFFEGENIDGCDAALSNRDIFIRAPRTPSFNDTVLTISPLP